MIKWVISDEDGVVKEVIDDYVLQEGEEFRTVNAVNSSIERIVSGITKSRQTLSMSTAHLEKPENNLITASYLLNSMSLYSFTLRYLSGKEITIKVTNGVKTDDYYFYRNLTPSVYKFTDVNVETGAFASKEFVSTEHWSENDWKSFKKIPIMR